MFSIHVTLATDKRSFSKLKIIKNYLRFIIPQKKAVKPSFGIEIKYRSLSITTILLIHLHHQKQGKNCLV